MFSDFLQNSKIIGLIRSHPKTTLALGTVSATLLILRKIQHNFIVFPNVGGRHNHQNPFGYQHPGNRGLNSEDLQIKTHDNITLRGWYVRQPKPEALLLYFHQNAGNIGGRIPFIQEITAKTKANVMIVAYRGFSDSDGKQTPNQKEIITDSKAILKKAMQIAQNEQLKLFVFGRSLGGAAGIAALAEHQPIVKGLILQNTFTNIYDVASSLPPFKMLSPLLWIITKDSFPSDSRISKLKVPILFIKGCKDQLVPKKLMDKLQSIANQNNIENYSYEVKEGTHNDTWMQAGQDYFKTINQFIVQCSRL